MEPRAGDAPCARGARPPGRRKISVGSGGAWAGDRQMATRAAFFRARAFRKGADGALPVRAAGLLNGRGAQAHLPGRCAR